MQKKWLRASNSKNSSTFYNTIIGGRSVIALDCYKCQTTASVVMNSVEGETVDAARKIETRFKRMGWTTDMFRPRRCLCPDCSKPVAKAAPGSGPRKSIPPLQPPEEPSMGSSLRAGYEAQEKMSEKVSDPRTVTPPKATEPRPLDVAQRTRVRDLLDTYFDVNRGAYTGDYSDHRIGVQLDLPWASVAQYRELAFGPLKEDSTDALRKDLKKIGTLAASLQTDIGKALDGVAGLDGRMSSLQTMLKEFEDRVIKAGL